MTVLAGFITRQFERTIQSTRRLGVILVLLGLIAAVDVVLLVQHYPSSSIKYGQLTVIATPAAVCPGETFTYPITISIDRGDAVSRVTEGWCRADDGICPISRQVEPYYLNFVNPYSVATEAKRTVPVDMPPGEWQLRHCNETHSNGTIDVVCYQVAVTVKDCQVKP